MPGRRTVFSVHPEHVVGRHAGAGCADNQDFGGVCASVQVAAVAESQPADGFGFDLGQFASEVGFDVGVLRRAGDGVHGGSQGLCGCQGVGIGLDCIVVSARCHGSLE